MAEENKKTEEAKPARSSEFETFKLFAKELAMQKDIEGEIKRQLELLREPLKHVKAWTEISASCLNLPDPTVRAIHDLRKVVAETIQQTPELLEKVNEHLQQQTAEQEKQTAEQKATNERLTIQIEQLTVQNRQSAAQIQQYEIANRKANSRAWWAIGVAAFGIGVTIVIELFRYL